MTNINESGESSLEKQTSILNSRRDSSENGRTFRIIEQLRH